MDEIVMTLVSAARARCTFTALLLGALLSAAASADEATIRRVLEPKLGGAKIEQVRPAPFAGLYEVSYMTPDGRQLIYADAEAKLVFHGNIFEVGSGRDLTEERLRKLSAIRFEDLPLDQAVKIQRGKGRQVLAILSDPYCPACREFEHVLRRIDDLTVYVFMYPVIRPELAAHSRAVWCAPNRAQAWLDLASGGRPPGTAKKCEDPIEQNLKLGRALGITATPTLIFANGERQNGGLTERDLRARLRSAGADRR